MDSMIQIHQGWLQLAVAGLAFFGWGWRVLTNLESRIEKRFDKIDSRMDRMDGRIAELEKGQIRLEGKMENLEEKVESLKTKVDHLGGRVDVIERKLDAGPLGMTTAVMAAVKGQMAIPFPGDQPPPPPTPQVEE